jgi:hypothetical protein
MEVWKEIKGYEGLYKISNKGNIYGIKFKKIKIATVGKRGYYVINLYKNGKGKTIPIHRLLAINFIPNPKKKATVNHIDGNKLNNDLLNLEWSTYLENNTHALKEGLRKPTIGENKTNSILTEQQVRIIKYANKFGTRQTDLAKIFNIGRSTSNSICTNVTWKHVHI